MRFAATSIFALSMAVAVTASDADLLKPALREVGDTLYTSVSNAFVNKTEDAKVAAVKGTFSPPPSRQKYTALSPRKRVRGEKKRREAPACARGGSAERARAACALSRSFSGNFNRCGALRRALRHITHTRTHTRTRHTTAAVSDKTHDVSGAVQSAADPLGALLLTKFHAIDDAEYEKRTSGCKKTGTKKPEPPGAYAFLGSGNLLPYYQGIVAALQDRGVLTEEVLRTARFSGFSGGSLTAVLTALGWPGRKQFALYEAIFGAVASCLAAAQTPAERLKCTLNGVGIPIVREALADTDVPSIINDRTSLWACQVNALGTTLDGSVAMGTTKVRGRARE